MKKLLVIACLTALSLTMWGTDVIPTSHDIEKDYNNGVLIVTDGYKIGTMADGTIYRCYRNAEFAADPYYNIRIKTSYGDSIIVDFSKEQLDHFTLHYNSYSGTIQIAVSADGATWTPMVIDSKSTYTMVNGLNGEKYIKIKSSTVLYISWIEYFSLSCHCLQVVSE